VRSGATPPRPLFASRWSENLGGIFWRSPTSATANAKWNSKSGHGWIQALGATRGEADEAERKSLMLRGEKIIAVDALFRPRAMVDRMRASTTCRTIWEQYTPIIPETRKSRE
jgi:hypothetical protein